MHRNFGGKINIFKGEIKMLTKKKKILILCTMLVLLVVTGYLNITLNNGVVDTSGEVTTSANFFEWYRTDRTVTRNESLLYWQTIMESSSADMVFKEYAKDQYDSIISLMTLESGLEGLIKGKGFDDVIAICSDNYVHVYVQSDELIESEVAQIVELIQLQTNKDIDYMKISPIAAD